MLSAGAAPEKTSPPVVPVWARSVDSEIGETGLQGADLERYANWLAKQRAGDATVAAKERSGQQKMYMHRKPVRSGEDTPQK